MTEDHAICNPAGSCCTPKVNDDAIREAATRAIHDSPTGCSLGAECHSRGEHRVIFEREAQDVIDAVRPLIEAQLRERLAAAIEARATHDPDTCTHECDSPYCFGCPDCSEVIAYRHAARLVRERP